MDLVNRILDRVVYWVLGVFFIIAIAVNAKELMWYQIDNMEIVRWTLMITIVYMIISWNKWTLSFTVILFAVVAIIAFLWLNKAELLPGVMDEINYYYRIYSPAAALNNGINHEYQPPVIFGLIIIVTVLYDLLAIRVRGLGILTLIGLALMGLNNEFGTLTSGYVVYVLLTVQILVYLLNILKKQSIQGYYRHWLTLLLVGGFFTSSVFFLTNNFKDPLSFLENYDYIDIFDRRNDESDIKLIYSNTERLVDSVHAGNTVVLVVESDVGVYLKGTILTHFDGLTWYSQGEEKGSGTVNSGPATNAIDTTTLDFYLNLLATGHDVKRLHSSEFHSDVDPTILNYYAERTVTITYKALYTDVIFQPINTYRVFLADTEYSYNQDGFIVSSSKLPTDYELTANYLIPLYREEQVIDLMMGKENVGAFDAFIEEWNQIYEENQGIEDWFENRYLFPYLILPESITSRTKSLAKELVQGLTDDYSKAKAIESYLKSNYSYDRVNLEMPDGGGDFVDYFLFESTEGYCTYFASAMAMMLRSEGIPARLVKGYVATSGGSGNVGQQTPGIPDFQDIRTARDNRILVRDKDAHAWVEAFIDGFGWVPFEPTSGFTLSESITDVEQAVLTGFEDEEETEDEETTLAVEPIRRNDTNVSVVGVISLLILMLLLATYGIVRILYQNKYKGRTIKESISWHEFFIRKILKVLFREKSAAETLKLYYERVAEVEDLNFIDFNGYYALLEKSYYSKMGFEVEDYNQSMVVYQQVLSLYRQKKVVQYYFLRLRYML